MAGRAGVDVTDITRIEGLDGLLETLERMPPELIKGARSPVAFGMRRGANVIRNEARQRAPKATGEMAKSIATRRANARQRRKAKAATGADEYFTVGIAPRRGKYSNTRHNRGKGRVGKSYDFDGWTYYWKFLEFGTKRMPAKPFLSPAGEAKGPEAAKVIAAEIREGIERIAKRHGWTG